MQTYTQNLLFDIKQKHFDKADEDISKIASTLIAGGNAQAYCRKSKELYNYALQNIVKEIFQSEKKALSSLESIPSERHFFDLQNEIMAIVDRDLLRLDEKIVNKLRPYTAGANIKVMKEIHPLISDFIRRSAKQLKEELQLEMKKRESTASTTNNTINNYGNIGALNQGESISGTQQGSTYHIANKTEFLKKSATVVTIIGGVLAIIKVMYELGVF